MRCALFPISNSVSRDFFRLRVWRAPGSTVVPSPHSPGLERKSGFVVNISSVAARDGGGLGALAYATAKGALSTMTKGLAKEFAPLGIRINAVSPGTINTNYHRNFSNDQTLSAVKAATPMARLGTSEEVADVILFLCSSGARFIQGQVIEVNGGFS